MRIDLNNVGYIFNGSLPINSDKSFQFVLVRLLIGPVNIVYNQNRFRQNINYSKIPSILQQNLRGSTAFKQFSTNYGIGLTSTQFVRKTISENRNFYQDVLSEFSHYFIQTERKAHLSAFVFLYRLLERISYSMPLLYSKKSHDFMGTFNQLKSLFTNDNPGENGFFLNFLKSGQFIDHNVLDATYNINFSAYSDGVKYFDQIARVFNDFDSSDRSSLSFEIKFKDVPSLLIIIRNRFFHLQTGANLRNISTKDLGSPDELFSELNKVICSCLAAIVLQIIAS
ncbi:hypothetical protein KEF85_13695 [Methylomonas paludis]|uniref:Uncharacterized protein n=1 Tax=Methylomonas paludis TaxID=1173101 RepID=A0A975MMK3_9GAMM|nr:hypothetical protein [Methylomonas paludis]QWF70379.1 hypothetical protein KEF85_13695 [Methylomonas paludis]